MLKLRQRHRHDCLVVRACQVRRKSALMIRVLPAPPLGALSSDNHICALAADSHVHTDVVRGLGSGLSL